MNNFQQYLEESIKTKKKLHTVMIKSHNRVLKTGKVVAVDPYLTIKTVSKHQSNMNKMSAGHSPSHMKHVGDVMTVLNNPNVNKKLKKMITNHIEVHENPKIKHAMLKFKGGKMIMMVNPKYIKKDTHK